MRSITPLALVFTFLVCINTSGLSQDICYCNFEKGKSDNDYKLVSIYTMHPDNYGHRADLRYKLLDQSPSADNAYQIEVSLGENTYLYQVHQLRLSYHGVELGYMSNLQRGVKKIIAHLFQDCPKVSELKSQQLEMLFNTDL